MKYLLLFCLMLTGCKGVDRLAQSSLYPFDMVEKKYKLQPLPDGFKEHLLYDRTHVVYGGEGKRVILYFHGNGENLEVMRLVKMFEALSKFGKFVVVDYPTQSKSTGSVDQAGLTQAAADAYQFAKGLGDEVVIWGRSLGAAVAIQLAKDSEAKKLIITSGWSSLPDVLTSKTRLSKFISKEWLAANTWDSATAASSFKGKVLLLHGDKDTLVPFDLGQKLSKSFSDAKFYTVVGADHNDIFQFKEVWVEVQNFLEVK